MRARWVFRPHRRREIQRLTEAMNISPILAQVLANRGRCDPASARKFLQPRLSDIAEPEEIQAVQEAAGRIRKAAEAGEQVLVYGDYDADGTCATALLVRTLRLLGLQPRYYIPHRLNEGYGLHLDALKKFGSQGVDLVITVDCGINACSEVKFASGAGMDIIVTDHHEPGAELPQAAHVLHPRLPGQEGLFQDLAGVGVAFKLAWALAKPVLAGAQPPLDVEGPSRSAAEEFLLGSVALVAIGTIADVVPLGGENRVFAKFGLDAIRHSKNPGIEALLRVSDLEGKPVAARDVAYRLAPRINAAGRLAEGDIALELLLTGDREKARRIAERLELENRRRQKLEGQILEAARRRVREEVDLRARASIVLADPGWHAGVVGIVASRIAEEFWRPTILISQESEPAKGSGRSIPGFHLLEALEACRAHLASFGGHARAAGVSVESRNLSHFAEAFEAEAARTLKPEFMAPSLEVDAEVSLAEMTEPLVSELGRLAPFGEGNPEPVFATLGVRVAGEVRRTGKEGQHLSFYARQGQAVLRAVGFGMGEAADEVARSRENLGVAFTPDANTWRGETSVELKLVDIKTS